MKYLLPRHCLVLTLLSVVLLFTSAAAQQAVLVDKEAAQQAVLVDKDADENGAKEVVKQDSQSKTSLISSKHDLITDGACKDEIKNLCNVKEGNAKIATCMRSKLLMKKGAKSINSDCRKEVKSFFKQAMVDPVEYLPELEKCSTDIAKYCKMNKGPFVMSCLKRQSEELTDDCYDVIVPEQILEAQSIDVDPLIHISCHEDLEKLCQGVSAEDGKQKLCLERNRKKLSKDCKEQLFEREVEDAGNLHFDVALEETCEVELKTYCSDGEYGQARKLSCLWEHQHDSDFSSECGGMVMERTILQEQDYRLDFRIRTKCKVTISNHCSNEKATQDQELEPSGLVLECLKGKYEKIRDADCRSELVRVIGIQNSIWLADLDLAKACHDDAAKFCPDERTENVNECLRNNFEKLSNSCQTEEFSEMKVEAQDIRMKPALRNACKPELKALCADVSHLDAQSLACLQDKIGSEDALSANCRNKLLKDMEMTSKDFRLKYGVSRGCQGDINALCAERRGNDVIPCLKENRDQIKGTQCKKEVKRLITQQMVDIKTSPEIKRACEGDIFRFCSDTANEEVHTCLQQHYDELSPECHDAEGIVQVERIEDVDVDPVMKNACKSTINTKCKDVPNERGEIMRCLEDALNDEDMPARCKKMVQNTVKVKNKELELNPIMRKECQSEWKYLDCSDYPGKQNRLECLINNVSNIKKKACKQAVNRKIRQRTEDALNDPNISRECSGDIKTFCSQTEPGDLHDCLFDNLNKLSDKCKEAEFKGQVLVAQAEEEELNGMTKGKCLTSKNKLCPDIPWSNGLEVLACLEDNIDSVNMGKACRSQLQKMNKKSSKSVKLNPFLTKHCKKTINFLKTSGNCPALAQSGLSADQVSLRTMDCLTTNYEKITSPVCKGNVWQTMKVFVLDYKNKPGMEDACQSSVTALCSDDSEMDYINNIECLKDRLREVKSKDCKGHIEQIRTMQSSDWMLNPALKKNCQADVRKICPAIAHGKSRVLSCLTLNENKLSDNCAVELSKIDVDTKALPKLNLLKSKNDDGSWLELRGWMALVSLASFVAVIVFGIYSCIRKNTRSSKSYTVVVNKD